MQLLYLSRKVVEHSVPSVTEVKCQLSVELARSAVRFVFRYLLVCLLHVWNLMREQMSLQRNRWNAVALFASFLCLSFDCIALVRSLHPSSLFSLWLHCQSLFFVNLFTSLTIVRFPWIPFQSPHKPPSSISLSLSLLYPLPVLFLILSESLCLCLLHLFFPSLFVFSHFF